MDSLTEQQSQAEPGQQSPSNSLDATSSSSSSSVPVQEIKEHTTCGLCMGPLAHSLVLSCSHLFCGDCLLKRFQHEGITSKQSCPTCNMDLRAVPVRCLAMDKLAAVVVPSLLRDHQLQYTKRSKDGQTAADQINKMLWWLSPPAGLGGPLGPAAAGAPGAAAPGLLPPLAQHSMPAGAFAGISNSSMGLSATAPMLMAAAAAAAGLEPKASTGLPAAHQLPAFGAAYPPPYMGPAGHLGASIPSPNTASFLHMAMAAQLAQAQAAQQAAKVQQQLGAAAAASLAAAAGGPHQRHAPPPGLVPDMANLQHMLLQGHAHEAHAGLAASGLVPPPLGHLPPPTPSPTGYHPDQLSGLMSNMCNV